MSHNTLMPLYRNIRQIQCKMMTINRLFFACPPFSVKLDWRETNVCPTIHCPPVFYLSTCLFVPFHCDTRGQGFIVKQPPDLHSIVQSLRQPVSVASIPPHRLLSQRSHRLHIRPLQANFNHTILHGPCRWGKIS